MTRSWEKYYSQEAINFDLANLEAQTLVELINRAAEKYSDRPALTTVLPNGAEGTITYSRLLEHANCFASYLRQVVKLQAGDTVAVMTPNCIGFGIACLGIAKAGCISTNVNPLYTSPELEHQLVDSNAKVLVIIDLFGDKVDEVIANTNVQQVVTLSLVDFFPSLKKLLVGFVLKRIKKVIPTMATPHIPMSEALARGSSNLQGADISAWSSHVKPTDTALYQYTSGTTAHSKGAELHHQGVLANAYQAHLMIKQVMEPQGETVVIALPLYHITAFALIFVAGISTGDHLLLAPSPRPPSNLKKAFENHKITRFTGINTLFAALLAEPWFDRKLFENIRFCGSGGAAQQTGVAQKWEAMTGVEIVQGYGMTECCGVLSLNPLDDNRLGTVGIPVPGMDVKIVADDGTEQSVGEPGEVIFKGPTIMKGYLNRPEATAEAVVNGWLHSGDIGIMDADGFIQIVDRKKEMILVSGFNVSPNEIEDVISKVEGVVQVGVIGVPDDKTGEAPIAFVLRKDDSLTTDTILKICRKNLTNYKVPRQIKFVEDIPTTMSGKVLRRKLRENHIANQ